VTLGKQLCHRRDKHIFQLCGELRVLAARFFHPLTRSGWSELCRNAGPLSRHWKKGQLLKGLCYQQLPVLPFTAGLSKAGQNSAREIILEVCPQTQLPKWMVAPSHLASARCKGPGRVGGYTGFRELWRPPTSGDEPECAQACVGGVCGCCGQAGSRQGSPRCRNCARSAAVPSAQCVGGWVAIDAVQMHGWAHYLRVPLLLISFSGAGSSPHEDFTLLQLRPTGDRILPGS